MDEYVCIQYTFDQRENLLGYSYLLVYITFFPFNIHSFYVWVRYCSLYTLSSWFFVFLFPLFWWRKFGRNYAYLVHSFLLFKKRRRRKVDRKRNPAVVFINPYNLPLPLLQINKLRWNRFSLIYQTLKRSLFLFSIFQILNFALFWCWHSFNMKLWF